MKKAYEVITDKIIEIIETKGVIPWKKPWRGTGARNIISKKSYRGINSFMLNSQEYENPYWLTFLQAKQLGGNIKKGEKGTPIVFFKFIDVEDEVRKIPFLKYSTVFNIEQCEGIEIPKEEKKLDFNPIERAEEILKKRNPVIKFGGDRAFFRPSDDFIQLPQKNEFYSEAEYYSTAFHELTHWTGHETRLDREGMKNIHFGSESYSKEELIAEMGASLFNDECGMFNEVKENSTAYIQSWLKVLKNDKKMIISAGAAAQKAFDYIIGEIEEETEI